ncbi:MAG: tetratricopeptide repeat protein [Muribaculaceae bacterium]|nr:tetratricopeptide repeat protein [Muribaculaceae bacterium]
MKQEDNRSPEEVIAEATRLIDAPDTAQEPREQALIARGMAYWKCGERAKAINDYNAAIRLNPASEALELRQQAYSILDFYHRDLYNP